MFNTDKEALTRESERVLEPCHATIAKRGILFLTIEGGPRNIKGGSARRGNERKGVEKIGF